MNSTGIGAGAPAERARAVLESGVNQTSARFLLSCAPLVLGVEGKAGGSADAEERLVGVMVMKDLYIKARAYALLNKGAFWPGLLLLLASVGWPGIEIVLAGGGGGGEGIGRRGEEGGIGRPPTLGKWGRGAAGR